MRAIYGEKTIMHEDTEGPYVKFKDIEKKLTIYFEWDPTIVNPAYAAKSFLKGTEAS